MADTPTLRRLLVTGGAGFIGSCYVRDVLGRRDGTHITVLDKLTYAGNEANLATVRDDPEMAARFGFVRGDIADPAVVEPLVASSDAVVNFAAESHVDRSILDPEAFLATGVIGVHVLLEACRTAPNMPRFLQVSTDEVYGSVDEGHAREDAPLAPRSPYAAAKAAGELLVRSYVITHGVDAVVTRGSNTTATASSAGSGCTSRITLGRSISFCAAARPARPTTSPGRPNAPIGTWSRCFSTISASPGHW